MRKRFVAVVLSAVVSAAGPSLAASLPELFGKVKEQVKAGSWSEALATMEVLDVEAAKPENVKAQEQLAGPLAFYRGVCDANLDNAARAQSDFETFLRAQPNASIDDKMYSKKAVAAFAAAQKSIASAGPSIARAYDDFKAPAGAREPVSASWGDGPSQWLMTPSEKSAWAAATTDAERAAVYDKFWLVRDTDEDHKFRATYDKRVAFSDANFTQATKRGSVTDRGMVFVLLGPPTYGGRRPIQQGEDANENSGMRSGNATSDTIAMHRATGPGSTAAQGVALADRQDAPSTKAPESAMNYQEVWHYRRELLPKGVSYLQVDAVFITKKGYGTNVLQRDSDILTTLDAAKQKPQ
jgi:GWxTD domain-containing protein